MGPHSFECGNDVLACDRHKMGTGFNGAALVRVRKFVCVDRASLSGGSFNGAALVRVRKSIGSKPYGPWPLASMGPHSFECGNEVCARCGSRRTTASMGPHSFECGNTGERWPRARHRAGFNGAALVRVRKFAPTRGLLSWGEGASMGPHSFECGNNGGTRGRERPARCFNGAALVRVRKLPAR